MTDRRLRVGVIGAGLIAQVVHLPLLGAMPERFELVALSEPSRRVREQVAARHRIARHHEDWRQLLGDEPLDAVVVCSPNHTHAEIVLAALDLGIAALVEKPLCLDPEDADRICARQAACGTVVQVGYMKRFDPAFEALLDGLPRDPRSLRLIDVVTYDPRLAREPFVPGSLVAPAGDVSEAVRRAGRRSELDQVGAALGADAPDAVRAYSDAFMGALVHDVNLVHGVLDRLGATEQVRPTAAHRQGAESAVLSATIEGGASLHAAWLLLDGMEEFDESLGLYFDDSVQRLRFPAPYHVQSPTRYERRTGVDGAQRLERSQAVRDVYRAELEHFHACVVERATCRTPPQQAARDIRLLRDAFLLSLPALDAAPVA